MWADPGHLAETMAVFAVRHLGPRAADAAARRRAAAPDTPAAALNRDTVVRGVRTTVAEGAFVGGPFLVLIPVAFCAALLGQARMVLEVAALHGHDTRAEARAADLLVLQGAFGDRREAAAAVAGVRERPHSGEPRLPRGTRVAAVMRMAAVLGITTPDGPAVSRVRRTIGWLYIGVLVAVGFVLPFVWIPAMAWSYHRATGRLGRRAVRYYASTPQPAATPARIAAPPTRHVAPLGLFGALRAFVAVVIPLAAAAFVVLADIRIGDSNLAATGLTLVVAGQVAAIGWYLLWRRHRHPRRRH